MSTLIDGASLLTPHPTGVSFAVRELLQQHLLPLGSPATIATVRAQATDHPLPDTGYAHLHRALPSKLVHAYCLAGGSFADLFPGDWSRLLLPNINIVGKPKLPFEVLVHDLSFLLHPNWFSRKTQLWHRLAQPKWLIQHAERVFAVSPQTQRALIDLLRVPYEKITIVPLHTRPILPVHESRPLETPYVLQLAADDPRKNSACLERGFLAFVRNHPRWKLVLAGTNRPSPHPNILTLPYLSTVQRIRWMQHAAAFAYPSWYEGYGLPLQEAHDLGVPILASSAVTVAETAPASTRFLPPYNPLYWTKALEELAANQSTD